MILESVDGMDRAGSLKLHLADDTDVLLLEDPSPHSAEEAKTEITLLPNSRTLQIGPGIFQGTYMRL